MEELDTETVRKMHGMGAANLYQIRRRVKATFAALLKAALEDLDAPIPPL